MLVRFYKHGAISRRANQFFKLDGLVEMVTRRVSEDFNGFLANRPVDLVFTPSSQMRYSMIYGGI